MNSLEGLRGCMNPVKEKDEDEVSSMGKEANTLTSIPVPAPAPR